MRITLLELAAATIILIQLKQVSAFQCFVCTKADDTCVEPKKEHLQECSSVKGKVTTCIKIMTQGQIVRTCGIPGLKRTTCSSTGGTTACICEREFCNSSDTRRPGFLSVVIAVTCAIFAGRKMST